MLSPRTSCCSLALVSTICTTASVVSADAWPATRVALHEVANRIANEDCRLLIVGDSNSLKTSSHTLVGGICRTWQPQQFVGRVSPGSDSSNDGIRVVTSSVGIDPIPRRVYHYGNNDPEIWSNGQDAFTPNRGWDMVASGSGLDEQSDYCVCSLTHMDRYPGGDWAANAPLKARLVFAHDQSGLPSLRYRATRGDVISTAVTFTPADPADSAWIDWVDVDVPAGNESVQTQVQTVEGWTNGETRGSPCPENCTPGKTLYHITQVIWRTDVPGLQVDSIAEGGFTAADHLLAAGHCNEDALRSYLAATRQPNCFLILLGQNSSPDELNDLEGLWRANVEAVVSRYRSAAMSLDPDASPLFVLVSPWSTDDDNDRFIRMSRILSDIATEQADVGFINLHLLAGSHRHTNHVYLHDGVHFGSDDSADVFAALLWTQIQRELDGLVDLVIDDTTDLENLVIPAQAHVHVVPGVHEGPLTIDSTAIAVRGWDNQVCGITGSNDGPALRVQGGASATVHRLHLLPGSGVLGQNGLRTGATVHIDQGSLLLSGVQATGGSVDRGGCLAIHHGALQIADSQFHGGSAVDAGGVLYADSSQLQISTCIMHGGVAAAGGGLALSSSTLETQYLRVYDCISDIGGGLHLVDSDADLFFARVLENTALKGFGGIATSEPERLRLELSKICGNMPLDCPDGWQDGGNNQLGEFCLCPGDVNHDGSTNVSDLLLVLSAWGTDQDSGDADNDGDTDVNDLLLVIQGFNTCD